MKLLTRAEEIILVGIIKLEENAYSITIKDKVSDLTGYEWPYGAVYVPLRQLERRRYVKKSKTKPENKRGGKSKIMYKVSEGGFKALRDMDSVQQKVWSGVRDQIVK